MGMKEQLLKSRLPEATVEIEGVGEIRVRGLSRAEVLAMRKFGADEAEIFVLAHATVDPVLTEEEARQWRTTAPAGELELPVNTILELSGLLPDARREAEKSVLPEELGEEVRVPVGEPPEDRDGGGAPGADE
jgi:hypothetical protein